MRPHGEPTVLQKAAGFQAVNKLKNTVILYLVPLFAREKTWLLI